MTSSAAKNIVIVSGNRIAPAATGGQVHSISIARALARMGHSVHIFSTAGRREDYQRANLRRGATMEYDIEPRLKESTHLGLIFGMMQSLARRLDYPRAWQHQMFSRGMIPKRLGELLRGADIVLSELPYCPPIPGPWRKKPWFLISHNLEHKLLEQGSARQRRFAGWMRRVEGAAPSTYTDILACAEEDQVFFKTHGGSQLVVPIVRCGVDPKLYAFPPEMRNQTRAALKLSDEDWVFVFSGSGYAPNVQAFEEIKEFCRAEADFLARRRIYIIVVGSVSSESYRDGALIVTGRVPEVLPYFAAGDAGLNMVTRGSGSNVKLFEYLAAKLPVISTPFGVRGTTLTAFEDYLPCTKDELKETLEKFVGGDRNSWRAKAEAVWNRHKQSCDIQNLVDDAVSRLPAFNT